MRMALSYVDIVPCGICAVAVFLGGSAICVNAAAPETPRPSSYAPYEDLLRQADFYLSRVEETLAGEKLDMAGQSRLLKDAHTLAMLGLVLSQHDTDFPERAAMSAFVKGAQDLAAADGEREKSQTALADLKAARAGNPVTEVLPLKWQHVASLPLVMKQVPLIHASLKRGATARRLERSREEAAGQAAALAAIAQASIFDDEYASSPEDIAAWQEICASMRDAAGEVNVAVRAGDADRVEAAMSKMLQSCEACHEKFR